MSVIHFVVGYDPRSEKLVAEHRVPDQLLPVAKRLADVAPEDPDAIGIYRLRPDQAARIASELGIRIDPQGLLWYLEPIEEDYDGDEARPAA